MNAGVFYAFVGIVIIVFISIFAADYAERKL